MIISKVAFQSSCGAARSVNINTKNVFICSRPSRFSLHTRHRPIIRALPIVCKSDASPSKLTKPDILTQVSSSFTNLFPLWTVIASAVALYNPLWFSPLTSPSLIQSNLSLLMLSTGLTLSPLDLFESFRKPGPILYNFLVCFAIVPCIALVIARVFGLEGKLRVGFLLLAIISGGQASNLCTHIAGGDTALSVAMTTTTTLAATFMLPLLSSVFLGTVVSVNKLQMALTTARVTLLPILVGATANQLFPRQVGAIRPILPVIGILSVIILVLGPVAQSATGFVTSWSMLLAPVLLIHLLGGVVGFVGTIAVKGSWKLAVTTAFETAFKSPALSFVLAKRLFPPEVELASAVSIVVLVPFCALFAVLLRRLDRRVTTE